MRHLRPYGLNELRIAVYLRDGRACVYCRRDLSRADTREITVDHVRPARSRGNYYEGNLVLACRRCNSSRGKLRLSLFASPAALARIRRQLKKDMAPYLEYVRRTALSLLPLEKLSHDISIYRPPRCAGRRTGRRS